MSGGPGPRPLALRAFNRVGSALRAAGVPLLGLDPEKLLAAARRATGLDDPGPGPWREGLERLVHSWETEAYLTPLGRSIARRDAVRCLASRLRITDTLRRHPEIEAGPVRAPLFVVGLPRTGTTILHELLAQDPANRVPMTWEVMEPWPPPERATYESDPRIARVERHFAGVDRVLPGFKTMHPMGALLPQECVALMAHDFACMIHHTSHRVPSYQAWLEALDLRPVYASHRRQLQYLQWRCPGEPWVLKSPGHLWSLDTLLEVYPDARIVQTHRDPLKVVASLSSLVATLRSLASDRIDIREIGGDWTARLARGLDAAGRVREAARLPDHQVADVHFHEFVSDEVGTVHRIYERFGRELSPEAADRMHRFLKENPRDKHGAHRYRLADAGLDPATERRRYRDYVERFGVREEAEV